jgi:GT2 family glycosyltransferase
MDKNQDLVSVVIPTFLRIDFLQRCLESVLKSSYKHLEIIVIDNNSDQKTLNFLSLNFKSVKVIKNSSNMGAARARKQGALSARGTWVLFIDDDNIIDKLMIQSLMAVVSKNQKIAAISPVMYIASHPSEVWFRGINISLVTSKASPLKHPPRDFFYECNAIHNVYMINKVLGDNLNWFDERLFMGYEEFDLLCKIKREGYSVGVDPKAICFHDISSGDGSKLRLISSPEKCFSTMRNRMIIMKRYALTLNLIFFCLFFYPTFFIYYFIYILKERRFDLISSHVRGFMAGYYFLFFDAIQVYV